MTSLGSHSWKEQNPDPNTGSCLSAAALVIPAREYHSCQREKLEQSPRSGHLGEIVV